MRMIVRGWQRAYQDDDRLAMSARHEMQLREADAAECIKVPTRYVMAMEVRQARKEMAKAFDANPLVPKPKAAKPPADVVTTHPVFSDARGGKKEPSQGPKPKSDHGKAKAMMVILQANRGKWLGMEAFADAYDDRGARGARNRQIERLEKRGTVDVRIARTRNGKRSIEVMML